MDKVVCLEYIATEEGVYHLRSQEARKASARNKQNNIHVSA